MMLGSAGVKILSYVTATYSATGTTTPHTFSGVSLGAESGTRRVIVGIAAGEPGGTVGAITGVTIGGVSATQITTSAQTEVSIDLWIALVPSGTTGDVVVSFSGSINQLGLSVWNSRGLLSNTPIDTGTSLADPSTDTLSTVNGGFCVAVMVTDSAAGNISWTNVTERFESAMISEEHSGGDATTTGANISPSGDASAGNCAGVFVTF